MNGSRRSRFRSDVNKAYRLIRELGILDDGELQYRLDVTHGPYYRIRRALLAVHPDIIHEHGFFKHRSAPRPTPESLGLDHWGNLEPEEQGDRRTG